MALGADPTCFGRNPQGQPIDLIADGTYAWDTTSSLGTQGLNSWIFALITLDAGGTACRRTQPIPERRFLPPY